MLVPQFRKLIDDETDMLHMGNILNIFFFPKLKGKMLELLHGSLCFLVQAQFPDIQVKDNTILRTRVIVWNFGLDVSCCGNKKVYLDGCPSRYTFQHPVIAVCSPGGLSIQILLDNKEVYRGRLERIHQAPRKWVLAGRISDKKVGMFFG